MKRALARIAAFAAAFLCIAVAAIPAQAAALPVIYASQNDFVHTCEIVGTDSNGYAAFICADIVTGTSSGGVYYATGQIEAGCTLNGVSTHCDAIYVTGGLYRQSNTSWAGDTWACSDGSSLGVCPASGQRAYVPLDTLNYDTATWNPQCTSDANGYTAIWTAVTSIDFVYPDLNEYKAGGPATAHYFVCNYQQ